MGARNVVLLGEVGSGKSSIINLIAGEGVAKSSNDAKGGTLNITCYTLNFSPSNVQVNLWDTPGWHPAEERNTRQGRAKPRVTDHLVNDFQHVYSGQAYSETPLALAVTGLELIQPNMHMWWENNHRALERYGFHCHAHACVTTVDGEGNREHISQNRLRKLVLHHIPSGSPSHSAFCPDGVQATVTGIRITPWFPPICFSTTPWHTRNDVLIIVTGPVGSGKSSFISKLTGIPEGSVGVSHSLEPGRPRLRAFGYVDQQSGKRVILLDAPGFPHSSQSNNILRMILSWVENAYRGNVPLGGILYLHSVAHQFTAISPERFSTLCRRCGETTMSKLFLVTTMWDDVSQTDGAVELAKCMRVWRPVLRRGEAVPRYLNTFSSAMEIVQPLLSF
ncbi:hypothetical protein BKA83DRAFT_3609376 [Pisolithus microcarpus]|nr:hypothetical protein BKA83DRAFT_3609376 [Pisolithus microcarpus]